MGVITKKNKKKIIKICTRITIYFFSRILSCVRIIIFYVEGNSITKVIYFFFYMTSSATTPRQEKSKRGTVLISSFKKSWKNSLDGRRTKISVCGFYRASDSLPPIVEQTCCYLEQHGVFRFSLFLILFLHQPHRCGPNHASRSCD